MNGAVSRSMRGINLALARLRLAMACQLASAAVAEPLLSTPYSMMGLKIPNPVGIAAGMDRTGRLAGRVSSIGFGFLEIGSVTPRNLNTTLARLQRSTMLHDRSIVGVNVACLRHAQGDGAIGQYVCVSRSLLLFADYLVVNLSSPFTCRARAAGRQWLETLLGEVAASRDTFQQKTGRFLPLAVKVLMAQDVEEEALESLQMARALGFQGAIAVTPRAMGETRIHETLQRAKMIIEDMTLVSVGGIDCATQVRDRLQSGAGAVQLFTGIVERGPFIARQIVSKLETPSVGPVSSLYGVP